MKQFRYIACSECHTISRISPHENTCVLCGHDIRACKEVTEREWRQYWSGILGQYPPNVRPIKKLEQILLPGGIGREKKKK